MSKLDVAKFCALCGKQFKLWREHYWNEWKTMPCLCSEVTVAIERAARVEGKGS